MYLDASNYEYLLLFPSGRRSSKTFRNSTNPKGCANKDTHRVVLLILNLLCWISDMCLIFKFLLFLFQTMYENCPEKCRCRIDNMNVPLWVEVSCSEANMSALPEILPPNTLKLNVSHNQVSENDINLFL